jgi:hypothetical protein
MKKVLSRNGDLTRVLGAASRTKKSASGARFAFRYAALENEHHFAQRYTDFLQLMVYGVKPDFDEAMATIASLVGRL